MAASCIQPSIRQECAKGEWKNIAEDVTLVAGSVKRPQQWGCSVAPNKQKQQKQIRWSVLSCLSAQRSSRYPVLNTDCLRRVFFIQAAQGRWMNRKAPTPPQSLTSIPSGWRVTSEHKNIQRCYLGSAPNQPSAPPPPQAYRVCHSKEFQLCSSSAEEKSLEFIPSGRSRSSPQNVQEDWVLSDFNQANSMHCGKDGATMVRG